MLALIYIFYNIYYFQKIVCNLKDSSLMIDINDWNIEEQL